MTLDDLAHTLPNGFHDATLYSLGLNYGKQEATLDLGLLVGDPESDDEASREAYRRGLLTLSGLVFCVIEPPDSRYPFLEGDALTIDVGPIENLSKTPSVTLPPVPDGRFINWVFVQQWNAFMYFAAQSAHLDWQP